jgi:hypothetical protein
MDHTGHQSAAMVRVYTRRAGLTGSIPSGSEKENPPPRVPIARHFPAGDCGAT